MNVKLLEQVKQHILAEPKRLDMGDWLRTVDPNEPDSPSCGTVGCIAGWTCFLSEQTVSAYLIDRTARSLLGLDAYEGERLFMPNFSIEFGDDDEEIVVGWPDKFEQAYKAATNPAERAEVTARRIDHFIATRGKE